MSERDADCFFIAQNCAAASMVAAQRRKVAVSLSVAGHDAAEAWWTAAAQIAAHRRNLGAPHHGSTAGDAAWLTYAASQENKAVPVAPKTKDSPLPAFGLKLICFFISPDQQEEMMGDYQELHMPRWRKILGSRLAGWCFTFHVIYAGIGRITFVAAVLAWIEKIFAR